jgi:anti-anti-sigma factor
VIFSSSQKNSLAEKRKRLNNGPDVFIGVRRMNIIEESVEDRVVFRFEGRLDATTAPQLETKIQKVIDDKHHKVAIDFSQIDYLSSAGMRLLLSLTKKLSSLEGSLVIFSLHDDVMEIIRMAGFEKVLHIFPSEVEALKF